MRKIQTFAIAVIGVFAALGVASCSDDKSYADLLSLENQYVNNFLADQRVINHIPEDNVFEYGPDAPYYRLDEDGQLYMQVINPGTPDNMVENDEQIYFRYTRYSLVYYIDGELLMSEGNDDVLNGNYSFRYGNFQVSSSYQYGPGVQTPLAYLPVDCEVNIIIKSQYGMPAEISYVTPFLYSIRYFRPKI